jgi:SAM-dependent methyltransferase
LIIALRQSGGEFSHSLLEFRKYGSSISMTHWYTGNEVPANVHTLGFSGAAMTSSNPAAELVLLVTGYRVSQAIHVAATLGIADIIKDGAASASDLAVATNSHAGALYRVLRALAAAGVFHEDDKKRFSLTPLGECLRSDAERSIAAYASFVGRPHQWQAWGSLSHSVRTGENAYRHVHGVGLWDYLVEHPEEAVIFDRVMTDGSRGVVEAIVSAYNFSAFGRVVDIGGGQGVMIAAVLAAHTNTHGILFDRPDVVARAQPVLEAAGVARRCAVVGGSFFETIPEGGDAYLLKYILHDWDDAASLAILAACRRVFRPEGRLLIMERIVGGPNDGLETKTSDLNMLVSPDGQERTADEFAALLANAGFRMERIIEVTPRLSIVEAAPI